MIVSTAGIFKLTSDCGVPALKGGVAEPAALWQSGHIRPWRGRGAPQEIKSLAALENLARRPQYTVCIGVLYLSKLRALAFLMPFNFLLYIYLTSLGCFFFFVLFNHKTESYVKKSASINPLWNKKQVLPPPCHCIEPGLCSNCLYRWGRTLTPLLKCSCLWGAACSDVAQSRTGSV